jgi:hypothetical protein
LYGDTDRQPSILWRLAWKDEPTAQRFADDITALAQCKAPGTSSASHFEVTRKGSLVALSNATDAISSTLLGQAVASRVTSSPPSPSPLGVVEVNLALPKGPRFAGRGKIDVHRSGSITDRHYTNKRLGFEADIPPDFKTVIDEILAIDRPPPSLASGRISFEQSAAPFDSPQDFFPRFISEVASVFFRGATLSEVATGEQQTAFGQAPYRLYELRSSRPARVRVIALPLCDRRVALVATEVFMDSQGSESLETWLRSFKPQSTEPAVCQSFR